MIAKKIFADRKLGVVIKKLNITHQTEAIGVTFGQSASSYALGRKNYPDTVFELFSTYISKSAAVLELGCGTGLATKQLYDQGFQSLVATDIDPLMLEAAKVFCPQTTFQMVDVNILPFQDHIFDSIVAFGCFHWFCTPQAIHEIKRVLKSQGLFFIVNKRDTGLFRENFRKFLERLEGQSILEPKTDYRPIEILTGHQFIITAHIVNVKELFTKEELLSYAQSISLWASLLPKKQINYMPYLLKFINDMMMDKEYYERPIEVRCLVAFLK